MKFLCVPCDEAMTLKEARGPDEGSMTVVFACPSCGRETAMLTNAMETQVVRSLGVKIGGRAVPAEPMEMVRGSLTHQRAPEAAPGEADDAGTARSSKCPFTGMVEGAYAQQAAPRWTPEAEARVERIPPYARPMVRRGIEQYARDAGLDEIDGTVMDAVRGQFGM